MLLSTVKGGCVGKPVDVVQGTVDLLIMKAIALEPLHGWAIAQRINQLSQDVLRVHQGSLYPALQRLERDGWIAAE
jgi:PadR family transcriptional regulator PadR